MTVRARLAGKGAASATHAVSLPASAAVGDRVFVGFTNDHAHASAGASTGWSSLGSASQGTTTNHTLTVFTRVLDGGANDALTVSITDSVDGNAREAQWVVVCMQGNGGTPETVVFNNGGAATSGTVGAITGLSSADRDSIIFLGLDNSTAVSQTVSAPSGWTTVTHTFASSDLVGTWSMDQSATAVTGFSPASVGWTNSEQWITAHVVVQQGSSEPIEKFGSDSATGSQGTGDVSATVTPAADTATGAETGSVSVPGSDSGTGSESGFVAEEKLGGDVGSGAETYDSSATVTPPTDTAAGAEAYNTSATVTPSADTAAGAEQGHIAIPGADSAAGLDAHVPPTLVTVTTGEGAIGSEGGYVETLFGDLIINLYAVDPVTGALIALPDYESLDFSRERNSKGAIRSQYPIDGKSFELLRNSITDSRDLEFELWTNGTPIGALRGYLQEANGDDVVADDNGEDGSWQFAGSFLECRTDEAVVFPQSRGSQVTDPDTGELVWTNPRRELIFNADTPGAVALTLLQQAQARDVLDDITHDFTTTHDSNGVAWVGALTARFSPGSTYTQILAKLVELHLIEWAIVWDSTTQQKIFKLWNAEGRGADLTVGPRPVTLRRGRNLLDAPRKWSVRDSATTMLAAGSEGVYQDTSDATALARRGRRVEAYTSLANATDESAVLAYAQAQLATVAPGFMSVEHGIGMLPGEPRPVIAFDIGDWIYSQTGVEVERLRVVQWTLTIDINRSLAGTVTLNDTIRDAVERLREKLNAISTGEAVVGTSEPLPDRAPDLTPPAMPQGVVASSIAYQDPDVMGPAQTLAMVTVGWNPVVTNADGSSQPSVQAAILILDRMLNPDPEVPMELNWTWQDNPQVVQDWHEHLLMIYAADNSPEPVEDWFADLIAENTQTPTAADDVEHYEVRYSYLGLLQFDGTEQPLPLPNDDRFYFFGGTTTGTEVHFGGVEGNAHLRIEVRAVDRSGNNGAWATIEHDTAADATPPPVPSAPTGLKTWFRTLDIPWDGLGSSGEGMPYDFSHVRVWIGQGADITVPTTPDPTLQPSAFDPLATGAQYVASLYAGGTYNIPDLPYGVGYFAALQAVDHSGNPSARSAVVGPVSAEQLFPDDLRDQIINDPNMIANQTIGSAQIVDAAIIRAKIGLLAVGSAQVEEIEVGKLTAGTMSANVILGGSIKTSSSSTAARVEMDAAGLRLYRLNNATPVGDWNVSTGNILVTGTYQSALSGQRINILPDGTFRMYATAGADYAEIRNDGAIVRFRSRADASGRRSRVDFDPSAFQARYGTDTVTRSSFSTGETYGVLTAGVVGTRIDRRFTPTDSTVFRAFWTHSDDGTPDGDFSGSVLHYIYTNSSAALVSPLRNVGLRFNLTSFGDNDGSPAGSGCIFVTDGGGGESQLRHIFVRSAISETGFFTSSTERIKQDIRPALDDLPVGRLRDIVRGVPAKSWKPIPRSVPAQRTKLPNGEVIEYPARQEELPRQFGLIAEELAAVAPQLVHQEGGNQPMISLMEIATVAWGAAAEAHDEIDELTERLAAVEAALARIPNNPVRGQP